MSGGERGRTSVEHALGLDFGTSALKAVLVDGSGTVLARASRPYPTQFPQPGWSQQDPESWWRALIEVAGELAEAGPPARCDRPVRPDAMRR